MFKECLKYNIVPILILDEYKAFYYRGLKEFKNEKGYLMDICLLGQDIMKSYLDYLRKLTNFLIIYFHFSKCLRLYFIILYLNNCLIFYV